MGKEMITRTVKGTILTLMALDTESGECVHVEEIVKGEVTDDNKAMKRIRKKYDGNTIQPVQIVKKEEVVKRYAMSEEDFLKNAVEIPLLKTKEN